MSELRDRARARAARVREGQVAAQAQAMVDLLRQTLDQAHDEQLVRQVKELRDWATTWLQRAETIPDPTFVCLTCTDPHTAHLNEKGAAYHQAQGHEVKEVRS